MGPNNIQRELDIIETAYDLIPRGWIQEMGDSVMIEQMRSGVNGAIEQAIEAAGADRSWFVSQMDFGGSSDLIFRLGPGGKLKFTETEKNALNNRGVACLSSEGSSGFYKQATAMFLGTLIEARRQGITDQVLVYTTPNPEQPGNVAHDAHAVIRGITYVLGGEVGAHTRRETVIQDADGRTR